MIIDSPMNNYTELTAHSLSSASQKDGWVGWLVVIFSSRKCLVESGSFQSLAHPYKYDIDSPSIKGLKHEEFLVNYILTESK